MTSLTTRFFMVGYSQVLLPRIARRMLARTVLHRAWLSGHMGVFEEASDAGSVRAGISTRQVMHYRKGAESNKGSALKSLMCLAVPFALR